MLTEPPAQKRMPRLIVIRGAVPRADMVADRCAFADRCDWAEDACRAAKPPLVEVASGRLTACRRQAEIADEMRALRRRALDDPAQTPAVAATGAPMVRVTDLVKTFAGRRGRVVPALK